jgi:4'-phosphopantetheinyl transferase EntD
VDVEQLMSDATANETADLLMNPQEQQLLRAVAASTTTPALCDSEACTPAGQQGERSAALVRIKYATANETADLLMNPQEQQLLRALPISFNAAATLLFSCCS